LFVAIKRNSATLLGALFLTTAFTAPAFAQIEVVVVTAEKRSQDVQTVPIAISVFGSEKRDQLGITSIQDMTNFTPGLQYSTSTDRISLRGVGRLTNVLSADASVANYDDGLYETFAVAAGRSPLDIERVEVLRGPQGTLYGRNAIAGALNEITRGPTSEFQGEVRATYGNYDHVTLEGGFSGPIADGWEYKAYVNWDYQNQGYAKNIVPGRKSEYGRLNDLYVDSQIQKTFFGDKLDFWLKYQTAWWYGGAGNAGSQSAGWNRYDTPTYEFGAASTGLNPGYGCTAPGFTNATANTTVVSATSPLPAATACLNPEVSTPWKIAHLVSYNVVLPSYDNVNMHLTWHAKDFDVKLISGGTYYHYILTGGTDNGGEGSGSDARAPISSYKLFSNTGAGFGLGSVVGLTVNPVESFNYQEHNGFISNELNFISTGDSPLQWVAGVYQFQQHYSQPVFTTSPVQPQWNGPFGLPAFFCSAPAGNDGNGVGTDGVCAPETGFRRFDNQPRVHATSDAVYGQLEYKWSDEFKFTGGLRYSEDRKYGTESVRLLCFGVPACFTAPENNFNGAFNLPAVDLTQLGTVVASGLADNGTTVKLPRGVTSVTTFDPATGLASRNYHASWGALTGTAKVDWTPDDSTLVYASYSKGYKSGGFNIGIFTVLSFSPFTDKEKVDSFEIGAKKSFGDWLTVNTALFHYAYRNLQVPLAVVQSAGGLSQSETSFINVPGSISQGAELETIISPIENLQVLFNYSYLDAHISRGQFADPADPGAIALGATPSLTDAQCLADFTKNGPPIINAAAGTIRSSNPNAICSVDLFASGNAPGFTNLPGAGLGWNKPQNLNGNQLPNAPKNKIAINLFYTWATDLGKFEPSVSYTWRDVQYGNFFTRSYNKAPSWDQVDARLTWVSADGAWEAVVFGRNILGTIGYDGGANGHRLAGTVDLPICGTRTIVANGSAECSFIQGVNNPVGYGAVRGENSTGQVTTYSVTPPALFGIELHYKL
jgi:iron complex outermembrane receptor protein